MSASEKLKALDAATPLEKYEIDLFGVLPQLIAVVEAAERVSDPEENELVLSGYDVFKNVSASLTALSEALERK